ncbi:MAG: hypothetical protein Q9163_003258 [Psora crenata]
MAQSKEIIPYEVQNASEWDPNRKGVGYSSSDESSDYEYDDDDWGEDNYSTSTERAEHDLSAQTVIPFSAKATTTRTIQDGTNQVEQDEEGFQLVQSRSKKATSKQPLHLAAASRPPQSCPTKSSQKLLPHGKSIASEPTIFQRGSPRPAHQSRNHRALFAFKHDNPAKAAFRKRLPPNGQFMLHKDAFEIEPNRMRMYDIFEEMGVRLNSFIRPPQDAHDRELLIWGNTRQVAQTESALREWLERTEEAPVAKSRAQENFSKVPSVTTHRYKADMKRVEREAAIRRFQQIPEPGRHFDFTGTYIWPIDEVNPQDIFGLSIEAFDTVRFEYNSHIIFDPHQRTFKIFSDNVDAVENSIARIEGALKGAEVRLKSGSVSTGGPVISKIPVLSGKPLDTGAQTKWMTTSRELDLANARRMAQALHGVLKTLPYYQGQLRMRVQFGTFELRTFKCPVEKRSMAFEEFLTNIQLSGTKGNLIRDLKVTANAERVMGRIFGANWLLVPADPVTEALKDVAPGLAGRFIIHRFNKPSVELEMEFTSSFINDGLYEVTHAQWTRHDQKETRIPYEAYMVRLHGGCSWRLKISNEHTLDQSRIDPKMIAFAESVRLKARDKSSLGLSGEKRFEWVQSDRPGSLKPSEFEQKTSYRYRLASDSAWMFEIARYDCYGPHDDAPVTTNWGASMWNTDWDAVLTQNSVLKIGEQADWEPLLSTFFSCRDEPENDPDKSILEVLHVIRMVNIFLDEVKGMRDAKESSQHLI